MTDFGRRTGQGDMLKSVYDPNDDGVVALAQTEADMTKAVYDPALAAMATLLAAHNTQHQYGGSDAIKLDALALPDDSQALDFSMNLHGLVPKGSNANKVLRDTGVWVLPTALFNSVTYESCGDPVNYDFTVGDLTTDGQWRTLNLCGWVPGDALAVSVFMSIKASVVNKTVSIRPGYNINVRNQVQLRTHKIAQANEISFCMACFPSCRLAYNADNISWTRINIQILGWWYQS